MKKTGHDTNIKDNEEKYFTTSDYNKFMNEILAAKMKQKELMVKPDLKTKLTTLARKQKN